MQQQAVIGLIGLVAQDEAVLAELVGNREHGVAHALVVPACIVAGGAIVVLLLTIGTPAASPVGVGRH